MSPTAAATALAAMAIATTMVSASVRPGTGLRVAARRIRTRGVGSRGLAALHVGSMIGATGTAVSTATATTAVTPATAATPMFRTATRILMRLVFAG